MSGGAASPISESAGGAAAAALAAPPSRRPISSAGGAASAAGALSPDGIFSPPAPQDARKSAANTPARAMCAEDDPASVSYAPEVGRPPPSESRRRSALRSSDRDGER